MNLNTRFKKLASLITCSAICAVMFFGGLLRRFLMRYLKARPVKANPL